MNFAQRFLQFMSAILKIYGPVKLKKLLWDKEFSGGKWNWIDHTAGDCVYAHLTRHLRNGNLLDLGCGPGNTANELDAHSYQRYLGVDISEAALAKARKRTEETGRLARNSFYRGDFLKFVPAQQFDVILFRESVYHVPPGKVKRVLKHYAKYLKPAGVLIVRTYGGTIKHRQKTMLRAIEREFAVIEKSHYPEEHDSVVIVFRPRRRC